MVGEICQRHLTHGLVYSKQQVDKEHLTGFVDADYVTDKDRRRSLTGLVSTLFGNTVSWKSSMQSVVALSTIEAEYMALTEAFKEAIWLSKLIEEMGICLKDNVDIHFDSEV